MSIVLRAIALLCFFSASTVLAAEPPPPPPDSKSSEAPNQPGYRVRPMPEDTFNPSEKVSEDYPIAFPADI